MIKTFDEKLFFEIAREERVEIIDGPGNAMTVNVVREIGKRIHF